MTSHLRGETAVIPWGAHLELCSQQFYASALQPLHPSHLIVTSLPDPSSQGYSPGLISPYPKRPASKKWWPKRPSPNLWWRARLQDGWWRKSSGLRHSTIKVFMATPFPINPAEQLLSRSYRSALSQVRSGYCSRLQSYRHFVGWATWWYIYLAELILILSSLWYSNLLFVYSLFLINIFLFVIAWLLWERKVILFH